MGSARRRMECPGGALNAPRPLDQHKFELRVHQRLVARLSPRARCSLPSASTAVAPRQGDEPAYARRECTGPMRLQMRELPATVPEVDQRERSRFSRHSFASHCPLSVISESNSRRFPARNVLQQESTSPSRSLTTRSATSNLRERKDFQAPSFGFRPAWQLRCPGRLNGLHRRLTPRSFRYLGDKVIL